MYKIPRLFAALVASAALLSVPVALAQDAKGKAAPAAKGKEMYSQAYFDFMLKQRTAQGQPDTPELRTAVRDELNTRELLVREARKQGIDKNPTVKTEMDLTSQTVLVRAFMTDYLKAHPVPEDQMHKEYDIIKGQIGDKEYKVRHILVDKESDAKDIIAALQKGEKFEKLAERSKDNASKINGGDLDCRIYAECPEALRLEEAECALQKGKFTTTPVQSQFGWHVIQLDDIRDAKVPPYDEVKTQLAQRMQGQIVEKYLKDLRAKNGL